jgi:hypothetical protein
LASVFSCIACVLAWWISIRETRVPRMTSSRDWLLFQSSFLLDRLSF